MEPDLQANVLGQELEVCSLDPLTGFFRDGFTTTGPQDYGSHTVCAVVTAEFLEHQRRTGNDLSTPMPQYGFPGLKPDDRWCLCLGRWIEAHNSGNAPQISLKSTHTSVLEFVDLDVLKDFAVDKE